MAVSFSPKYGIVPKEHKSEEEIKAIAVYLKCQDMCSDSPNCMKKMVCSSSQERGRPSAYWNVAALVVMPIYKLTELNVYVVQ